VKCARQRRRRRRRAALSAGGPLQVPGQLPAPTAAASAQLAVDAPPSTASTSLYPRNKHGRRGYRLAGRRLSWRLSGEARGQMTHRRGRLMAPCLAALPLLPRRLGNEGIDRAQLLLQPHDI